MVLAAYRRPTTLSGCAPTYALGEYGTSGYGSGRASHRA